MFGQIPTQVCKCYVWPPTRLSCFLHQRASTVFLTLALSQPGLWDINPYTAPERMMSVRNGAHMQDTHTVVPAGHPPHSQWGYLLALGPGETESMVWLCLASGKLQHAMWGLHQHDHDTVVAEVRDSLFCIVTILWIALSGWLLFEQGGCGRHISISNW